MTEKDMIIGHCTIEPSNNFSTMVHSIEEPKTFKVKKLDRRVILPEAKWNAAGLDLRVLTDGNPVTIKPGKFHKFSTGIQIEPPEGEYVRIYVRSSVGCKKHLALMNGTGIIDPDYRGEILVFVWNFGSEEVIVDNNERLCQMIFDKQLTRVPVEVTDLSITERGMGGFGSSGVL